MTNKIYYQAKNPVACIAFANYMLKNRLTDSIPEGEDRVEIFINDTLKGFTVNELYKIWEELPVDKTAETYLTDNGA